MRCKIDEDLPRSVQRAFARQGHDAPSVRDQDMQGWPDSHLWRAVQAERRVLITADKGFGDLRAYPPGTHHGIVLFRPDHEGPGYYAELADALLQALSDVDLRGCLAVVTPRGIRLRRPLPEANQ